MSLRYSVCLTLVLSILSAGASAQWTVVNLHPTGAMGSSARGVSGGQQVGSVSEGDYKHASLWSGASGTWVNLTPSGATESEAFGVQGGQQAGVIYIGPFGFGERAGYWRGSAASWVDLHPAWADTSAAYGTDGLWQVGATETFYHPKACMWSGTAASYVSLSPNDNFLSCATAVGDGQQVGYVGVDTEHASLWTGTAASWVDLHPAGAADSNAFGVGGGQQVGQVTVWPNRHASLWSGTAASWVDLNPAGATDSSALAVAGGLQVGQIQVGGVSHASLWSGNAASWVDLHKLLPARFGESIAMGIWRDAAFTYVVGYGYSNGVQEALMWRAPRPPALGVRSANPTTGVPMTVWIADVHGLKNGTTSFDRIYSEGTIASVTAPQSVGNQLFDHWEKDTVPVAGGQRTISVLMDVPHIIKAVYLTRRRLTVTSQDPNTGVPITVWTIDKSGLASGSTQFQRTYTQGTSVSLSAPALVGNNSFRRWNLDGVPWQATKTVLVPMGADHTVTAVYAVGQVLSVNSVTPNVPVTVWNADLNGLLDGTTNFTRLYAAGANASLTAPAQVGGRAFIRWEKDGVAVPGTSRTVKLTMDGPHTMNVVYTP